MIDQKQNRKTISKPDTKILFEQWVNNRDEATANMLIEIYTPLVNIITEKIYKTLPNTIIKDELKSLGLIGLYEALEKYEPARDLKFETYASFRIRGAILDGLRKEDWLPRKTREKTKRVEGIVSKLEQKYLRSVTPEEIAKEAELSPEEVRTLIDESYFSNVLSIDEHNQELGDSEHQSFIIKDEQLKTPEEELVHSEIIKELTETIASLSEKEQLVLSLFYKEELTFTEIGHILELSTSRISQIHSKALAKMRSMLEVIQLT